MVKKAGLMFAGQGSQYVGMCADLYEKSDAAREIIDLADSKLGWSVSDVCFNGPEEKLTSSKVCQPAIYTVSAACLRTVLERFTIEPIICGGLSLGEFSAASAAGVFSFEDGLELVQKRGELMEKACRDTEGAMAAVLKAERETVEKVCKDNDVDVANYNCPGQIVISGEKEKIENALQALKQAGVSKTVPLEVDGAFHSRLMQPAADKFGEILAETEFSEPQCELVQNYAGNAVSDPGSIRNNFQKQVSGSVRWEECVRTMLNRNIDCLIEIGPGKVLSGFMKRIDRKFPVYNVEKADDLENLEEVF